MLLFVALSNACKHKYRSQCPWITVEMWQIAVISSNVCQLALSPKRQQQQKAAATPSAYRSHMPHCCVWACDRPLWSSCLALCKFCLCTLRGFSMHVCMCVCMCVCMQSAICFGQCLLYIKTRTFSMQRLCRCCVLILVNYCCHVSRHQGTGQGCCCCKCN